MSERLTQADIARRWGVTRQTVGLYLKAGLPRGEDGRLDAEAADAWRRDHVPQARPKPAKKGVSTREALDLKRLEKLALEVEERRGALVERAAVERAVFSAFRVEREAWRAWAARTAPLLAHRFKLAELDLAVALDRAVAEHLDDLAAHPWRLE